jgi:hypothetical protein
VDDWTVHDDQDNPLAIAIDDFIMMSISQNALLVMTANGLACKDPRCSTSPLRAAASCFPATSSVAGAIIPTTTRPICRRNPMRSCPAAAVALSIRSEMCWRVRCGTQGILTAEIDIGQVARAQYDFDPVGHYSRPDIFSLSVDKREKRAVNLPFPGEQPNRLIASIT